MSDISTALSELAERVGILPEYLAATGEVRRTPAPTVRRVLKAMSIDVQTEADALGALADVERQQDERALPPVLVLHQTKRPFRVPVRGGPATAVLNIALESGRSVRIVVVGPQGASGDRLGDQTTRWLALPEDLPCGYHHLTLQDLPGTCHLIVTPGTCWLPSAIAHGQRSWGVAAQLYLLRSPLNWGIGDFRDLKKLTEVVGALGADVVGLNPLHAPFTDRPEHASPYSPASRLLLNPLYIDLAQAAELINADAMELLDDEAARALQELRSAQVLDYTRIVKLKFSALERLYDRWRARPDTAEWQAFLASRRKNAATIERHILFLALREHFAAVAGDMADWHQWPAEYHDPCSPAVLGFAQQHEARVTFQAWLQYLADGQLEAAAQAAAGMSVGMYRDLAVGTDTSGAETWANQASVVADATVGAPPDIYNPAGQNWGLPPINPQAWREEGYSSFVELIRANMRHAGALRIDHVMALQQLYWIPRGAPASQGAYVRYPLEDLVGILTLESTRHRCLIVGEDLGTVPEGFREAMQAARILSYRVLFFEKNAKEFVIPEKYPALSVAVAGSHDLPTIRAWWEGTDLTLKQRLELFPEPRMVEQAAGERDEDRGALLSALRGTGILRTTPTAESLFVPVHEYLAQTRSSLALVQLDDICDEADPVNVPCTSNQYPNWRRRLSLTVEEIAACRRLSEIARMMQAARPKIGDSGACGQKLAMPSTLREQL